MRTLIHHVHFVCGCLCTVRRTQRRTDSHTERHRQDAYRKKGHLFFAIPAFWHEVISLSKHPEVLGLAWVLCKLVSHGPAPGSGPPSTPSYSELLLLLGAMCPLSLTCKQGHFPTKTLRLAGNGPLSLEHRWLARAEAKEAWAFILAPSRLVRNGGQGLVSLIGFPPL